MIDRIKMVRDAAPALDRAYRRVEEGGYREATDAMSLKFTQTGLLMRFDDSDLMSIAGGVFVEEMSAGGWGGNAIFDNGDAITGKCVGYRFTHPVHLTRVGTEIRDRPQLWRIEGPMPDGRVQLDHVEIERLTGEVAECARDMFRKQAHEEGVDVSMGPLIQGNPLETRYDRDRAEWNGEVVQAAQPRQVPPPPTRTPEHIVPVKPLQTFQVASRNGEEPNRAE